MNKKEYSLLPMIQKYYALVIFILIASGSLTACIGQEKQAPFLQIENILHTEGQVVAEKPMPQFQDLFETGVKIIRSYVQLRGMETMTGSVVVHMQWFSPNDLRPPFATKNISIMPHQNIAEFTLGNEGGLRAGPYKVVVWTSSNNMRLTATGSSRFFIGLTEQEALTFIEEERKMLEAMAEQRKRREEERALLDKKTESSSSLSAERE